MEIRMTGLDAKRAIESVMSGLTDNAEELLEQIADEIIFPSILQNFKEEGRPRWADLSERSQRERKFEGYNPTNPILQRTGELMTSSTEKNGYPGGVFDLRPKELTISNVLRKAETLQNGDWNLPERPFFYLQDGDYKKVDRLVVKHIQKKIAEFRKYTI